MNFLDHKSNKNIFAALKFKKGIVLGRVININIDEIVIHCVFDDEIHLDSVLNIDVFESGKTYLKDQPVKVISDEKFYDDLSFSKMLTREIKVKHTVSDLQNHLKDDSLRP